MSLRLLYKQLPKGKEGETSARGNTGHLSMCAFVTHNDLHLTPFPAIGLIEVNRAPLRRNGPKFSIDGGGVDGISFVYKQAPKEPEAPDLLGDAAELTPLTPLTPPPPPPAPLRGTPAEPLS